MCGAIQRGLAATHARDSSGHNAADATEAVTAAATGAGIADGDGSIAEAVVAAEGIADGDGLNAVQAEAGTIADTTAGTRHNGGHN